jgi:uncharacterized protein YdeI (YjbR/CyaY-like superfamily)
LEDKEHHYFKNTKEWRDWLNENHHSSKGVYLIFYKVSSEFESMRWEEAVQVAICFGWIDSTVRKMDEERRKQVFSPRKDKSVWSKLNKTYIEKLIKENLMQESGLAKIEMAKKNGSWASLDAVEDLIMPVDLEMAFNKNSFAFENYKNFSPSYRKLSLLAQSSQKRRNKKQSDNRDHKSLCPK